jgi:cytoskeletal protein RodZ
MFRKLSLLALLGGAVAYLLKQRGGVQEVQPSTSPQQATTPAPEDLAEVRSGQTQDTVESPVVGAGDDEEAVIPDTSADDPLVREQEEAARADAGSIGGEADTVTADTDPAMRPVVEGAGDAPETFETTDEQGR